MPPHSSHFNYNRNASSNKVPRNRTALPQWTVDLKTYAYADIQTTEEENQTFELLSFYVHIDVIRIVWISSICRTRIIRDSIQNLVDLIVWICFMVHFMYWNSSNLVTLFYVFMSSGRVPVMTTKLESFYLWNGWFWMTNSMWIIHPQQLSLSYL